MHVYVWLYRSLSSYHLSGNEVLDILSVSMRHNEQENITGMLLHHVDRFTQVIEGPKAAILALKAKIIADPRHRDVTTLYEDFRPERVFAHWSMAFRKLDAQEQLQLNGYMPLEWGQKTLATIADQITSGEIMSDGTIAGTNASETNEIAPVLAQMSAWMTETA
jgi:hypothetical protein